MTPPDHTGSHRNGETLDWSLAFVSLRAVSPPLNPLFEKYTRAFADFPTLAARVLAVLNSLPETVQSDFLGDTRFRVELDNFEAGKGWSLFMDLPSPTGEASRCVVLKKRLDECNEAFAHYVIAHEFAHAYLRNGGWNEIADPEDAADALAATWGFSRPATKR